MTFCLFPRKAESSKKGTAENAKFFLRILRMSLYLKYIKLQGITLMLKSLNQKVKIQLINNALLIKVQRDNVTFRKIKYEKMDK